MKIEENYSLLKHNTFGLNIKTRWFIEYDSEDELKRILSDEYFLSLPFLHIGEGSNLLFLQDYEGIILHSGIQEICILREDNESVLVKVGAGINWDYFVDYCVKQQWGGIENLSLIPGEVGASAVQNIGAYGVEACDSIVEVHAYNIENKNKECFTKEACDFSYRNSIFKNKLKGKYLITHVVFQLNKKPVFYLDYGNLREFIVCQDKTPDLQVIRDSIISIRNSKLPDPKDYGNAGSFFMNPYVDKDFYENLKKDYPQMPFFPVSDNQVKIPAAWLIDQCGLKGKTYNDAAVYEKQPLVIINKGNATGTDIAMLAEEIKTMVLNKFGIVLIPEVYYISN